MKRPFTFILTIVIAASSLSAQSPYKISWEKDKFILGAGGIGTIAGFFLDRSVSSLTPAEINQLSMESVNTFDRSATYRYSETASTASDILLGITTAAPLLLFMDQSIRNDWQTISLMGIETWSLIGAATLLTKGTVERIRPFVYNPDVPINNKLSGDSRKSFFSGHTTAAFASVVFLSTVYCDYNPNSEWKPYIWAGSLLTASIVGFSRYEAGAHFPTDILVGAIVGSAIGYTIPWIHRNKKENLSIIPSAPYSDYGFSMQVRF